MTLKLSRNVKVTRALTGRRPMRPAADADFEIQKSLGVAEADIRKCSTK